MKWRDFREQECILTMTDVEASGGETVNLIPAATPFVTNTEGDTNPMTPMRSGSGSINFIGEDGVSIVPRNSHQWRAVLTVNGMVMWTGWLKAETFNQRLWGVNEDVSLNVIDDIEALKTWTLDTDKGFGMVSLRSLICECVDHVHNRVGNDLVEVMFSKDIWPGVSFDELFDLQVSRYNFFTSTEYGNEGQTCYEVLESICKTFGWSLSETHGTGAGIRLLFSYAGAREYRRVDYERFRNGEWTDMSEESPLLKKFYSMTPMGMHDYSIEQGYKLISVVSEVNLVNNLLPQLGIDNSNVKDVWDFKVEYQRNGTPGEMDWRVRLLEPKNARTEFPKYTLSEGVKGTPVPFYGAITEDNFDRIGYYGIYPISHDYWGGPKEDPGSAEKKEDKINYEWSDLYLVRCMDIADNTHPLLIARIEGHCLYGNGGFEIGMELHVQDSFEVDPGVNIIMSGAERGGVYGPIKRGWQIRDGGTNNPRVVMLLRVGDKWWNGEAWENQRSTFSVTIWGQQAFQYNHEKTNKVLDWKFNATHYAIPINTTLQGDTELQIIKVDYGNASNVYNECLMKGLTFNYCEAEDERKTTSENSHEYKHKEEGWTENLEPVRLNIYSDKNDPANYGVLQYASGATVKNMYDNLTGQNQRPEEALLDKMKSHFSKTRELLTLRLRHNLNLSAQNKLEVGGKEYHILALRSVDWRTQEVELLVSD